MEEVHMREEYVAVGRGNEKGFEGGEGEADLSAAGMIKSSLRQRQAVGWSAAGRLRSTLCTSCMREPEEEEEFETFNSVHKPFRATVGTRG